MTRRLEVHIEELVLHGFAAADRRRIGDALQAELERQFSAQDLPTLDDKGISIARLACGVFRSVPGSPCQNIGADLARSLHRGLSQSVARSQGGPMSFGERTR
jgi:hypothetical protein